MRLQKLPCFFILVTIFTLIILRPTICYGQSNELMSSNSLRGVLFEEKTRLGSTPPSCHNKCNDCHPCMAVQVPTIPSHNRVDPGMSESKPDELSASFPAGGRYSNYKPLGWKCRCGNRFYNP